MICAPTDGFSVWLKSIVNNVQYLSASSLFRPRRNTFSVRRGFFCRRTLVSKWAVRITELPEKLLGQLPVTIPCKQPALDPGSADHPLLELAMQQLARPGQLLRNLRAPVQFPSSKIRRVEHLQVAELAIAPATEYRCLSFQGS